MNFISRIIKSINAMRERLKIERHEAMYGPHFNEECALKAVSKMENEDGSRGEHWSLEETTSIANQYGINLKGEKYNKYDWYVALNMIRSDYYRAVVTMTNGFGRGSDDASRLASQLNTDTNTSLLMQAIQGNKDAISTLSNTLSCDINAVQTALNTINTSVSQIACDTKLASCEVINAITSGNANLASQLANCCCQTQRSIDSVNLNLTQMNADNRLSICQQTNTLQNAITGGFNNLMTDNASKFNVIGAKIDAQTQMINDKFCQLEMREMQNKIDTLRAEKSALELGLSQSAQTANIVNQLRPCPVPAYLTCNPFGCNGGFTGYGYGYNDGCGCSC